MRNSFILLIAMIAMLCTAQPSLQKRICGSWIIAEHTYQNPVYMFDSITKYHQINATMDDAIGGILVSEVDVISGEQIQMLFTIVINSKEEKVTDVTIHSLSNEDSATFHLHNMDEGIQVRNRQYWLCSFLRSISTLKWSLLPLLKNLKSKSLLEILIRIRAFATQEKRFQKLYKEHFSSDLEELLSLLLPWSSWCLFFRYLICRCCHDIVFMPFPQDTSLFRIVLLHPFKLVFYKLFFRIKQECNLYTIRLLISYKSILKLFYLSIWMLDTK